MCLLILCFGLDSCVQSSDLQDEHNHVEDSTQAAVDAGTVAGAGPQGGRAKTIAGRSRRRPGCPHKHAAAVCNRLSAGRTTATGS
jgi:hypothetical protein